MRVCSRATKGQPRKNSILDKRITYVYLGILRNRAITETPTIRGKTGAGVKSCKPWK